MCLVLTTWRRAMACRTRTAHLPSLTLSLGGAAPGPCFFMKKKDSGMMPDMGPDSPLADALRHAADGLKPTALLIISAHWENQGKVAVTTKPKPGLLFDYYVRHQRLAHQARCCAIAR